MKYSVIMPTYNCEKYVTEAIKSILNQSYSDFELIVVDDGSQDNTAEVARLAISDDNRARVIAKEHAGVSAARNRGIEEAKGEYLLFIDGDDTWHGDLLLVCSGHTDVELFVFNMQMVFYDNEEKVTRRKNCNSKFEGVRAFSADKYETMVFINTASPCNKVYRRDVVGNLRFCEDCVYLEDLKFNLDYFSRIKTVTAISDVLYYYRRAEGENLVAKRKFGKLFANADEFYDSVAKYAASAKKEVSDFPTLASIALRSYHEEFAARFITDKNHKRLMKDMSARQGYKALLKNSRGKFFTLFKMCGCLKFRKTQAKMLVKRYYR